MKMVKVVVFDIGGTLIGANDLFLETCKVLGRPELHEDLRNKFWEVAGNNPDLSEDQALMLASSLIAQIHGLDESLVAGLSDEVFISSSKLHDGVFDVLSFLKEEGVLMFVASDSDFELMIRELKKHNIFNFFSDILTSSLVKAYKPSDVFVKRIHQSIIDKCPVPEKIFFVGDSDADIKSALRLGDISGVDVVPVFIARQGQVHNDAKHNIKSISQLKDLI